jgi:predicted transposase YdaD
MPLPFDATLKDVVREYPEDYGAALGLAGPHPIRALNVDLSTITAATDVILGHGDPPEHVTDLNFQSGPDPRLAGRLLLYNAALYHRFMVPVHSVAILLRPAADSPGVAGRLRYEGRKRRGRIHFTFEVVRLWQRPVRPLLRGGLGTLPMATLCQMPAGRPLPDALREVVRAIDERLHHEAPPGQAAKLLTAAYVLTGLRLPPDSAAQVFQQGVMRMRESTTYQAILDEGRVMTLKKILLRQGRLQFGTADAATEAAVQSITDGDRLERMTERVLTATSWQELLQTP